MRAVGYDAPGDPLVLHEIRLARPEVLPSEVLVRVHASSINPIDWRTRGGWRTPAAHAAAPGVQVLGWDVSGTVAEIGHGVHRFRVGDEVFGLPWFPRPARANAEFVAAPSRQFARKPENLSHAEAAALPLAGLTALHALTVAATTRAGQRVLVHAGAGGVGHLAIQIAHSLGAEVVATARTSQHDWLRSLGATEVIDHHVHRFEEVLRPVDVVLDLVGGDVGPRSVAVLKAGGTLVRVAPGPDDVLLAAAAREGVTVTPGILVEPDGAGLDYLAALAETGRLTPRISRVYPISGLADAHAAAAEGHTVGKIAISLGPDDWQNE
ncbi:hypothetical protein ASF80_17175 [Microbacterium sp. Leaf159]|nr:hypothetical protein ASF80_17175 [Microbacterium sp. Leaf159]